MFNWIRKILHKGESSNKTEDPIKKNAEEFNIALNNLNAVTGEKPYDTQIEVLSEKSVISGIILLLSYIRFIVNNNLQRTITVRIGYRKPTAMPFHFTVNDQVIDDIYPGEDVDIN